MTWLLLSIVIAATVASDLLQSYEMKQVGTQPVDARGLGDLLKTVARRRYLILSIACLAVSFFSFMALVNWTTMVTVPSPTEVGPAYCQTLARTRLMVYGVGSWFFHTRLLPCGVI